MQHVNSTTQSCRNVLQIAGAAQIPLAEARFILDPGSVVPVAVGLMRPERVGLGKFVGGGIGGVAKAGAGVGKAGISGTSCLSCLETTCKPTFSVL